MRLLSAADHMQAGYIESRETEFSADIDWPEDFQLLLGISWQGAGKQSAGEQSVG